MLEFATAITVSVNGKIKPNPHEAPNFVGVEGSVSMFHRQTPPRNVLCHRSQFHFRYCEETFLNGIWRHVKAMIKILNACEVRMDHDHVGFVSRDGSFSIHNVAVGTYILHVISPKLSYVPIRIDVGNQGT